MAIFESFPEPTSDASVTRNELHESTYPFHAPSLYQQTSKVFMEVGSYLLPQKAQWTSLLLHLAQISSNIREYSIVTIEDIEPIWARIRTIPHAESVLTYTIADLTLVMEPSWSVVATALAESLLAVLPQNSEKSACAMDVPFFESFPTPNALSMLLNANRWLVMLFLLRRAGVFSLANRVAITAPPAASEVEPVREGNFTQGG